MTCRVVATEIFTFKAVTDQPDWARRMRSKDEIWGVESWTGVVEDAHRGVGAGEEVIPRAGGQELGRAEQVVLPLERDPLAVPELLVEACELRRPHRA